MGAGKRESVIGDHKYSQVAKALECEGVFSKFWEWYGAGRDGIQLRVFLH